MLFPLGTAAKVYLFRLLVVIIANALRFGSTNTDNGSAHDPAVHTASENGEKNIAKG